jgi:hypothetical protein
VPNLAFGILDSLRRSRATMADVNIEVGTIALTVCFTKFNMLVQSSNSTAS